MNDIYSGNRQDDASRLSFDTTLVYAASDGFRWSCTLVGFGLAGLGMWAASKVYHLDPGSMQVTVGALLVLATAIWLAALTLQGSVRLLLLEPDEIAIPVDSVVTLRWPYSDVAGYTFAPKRINLGLRGRFSGREMSIASRRPGVDPLVVFVYDAYPIGRAMLARLDAVVRVTGSLPPLSGSEARRSGAVADIVLVTLAVLVMVASVPLLSPFGNALGILRHGTPQLSALQHVEGLVTGVSNCWTRSRRNGGDQAMNLTIADPAGPTQVAVPCVLDHEDLLRNGPHRVAIDLDPDGKPPNLVYQLSLDGQVALSYDAVKNRRHHDDIVPARWLTALFVVAAAFLLFVLRRAWKRSRRGAGG